MYDLIIYGGTVIDPSRNFMGKADVGIYGGKVTCVGNIPRNEKAALPPVDAEGCYVTPGLIDHHAHAYRMNAVGGVMETIQFTSGVTTIVDQGTLGACNYENHRPLLEVSKLRVKSYISVCPIGLESGDFRENVEPSLFDRKNTRRIVEQYRDDVLGLKIRMGTDTVGDLGTVPLKATVELAEELGTRVCVHCSKSPVPIEDLLDIMRPGDILAHPFNNFTYTIVDENGHISKRAREAHDRGVVFDLACGRVHSSIEISKIAAAEGFWPDIISTDMTEAGSFFRPSLFNLLQQVSLFYNLGMPLMDVLRTVTSTPAHHMNNLEGKIGCLKEGCYADVAILRELDQEKEYGDRTGATYRGSKTLKPMMTIKDGDIVYRDFDF